MRLPWWPIYIDAHFDEQGVYYTIADEPEQLVPWHSVRFSNQSSNLLFFIEDDQGCQVRLNRSRLLLRVKQKENPDAATRAFAFQKAYLENPENQYTCKVNWKSQLLERALMLILSVGLPIYILFMMIEGYNSAPDNDPGIRYQSGVLMSMGVLMLITLFINWRIYKGFRRQRKAPRILEVNQLGVVTNDSDYPWDTLERIDPHFTGYIMATQSGQHLLLPNNNCVTWIVRKKITHPPALGYKLFLFCLLGSILSGPLMRAWYKYLLPEEDFSFGMWGASIILTSMVLFLFGGIYLLLWLEKRRESKSQ